MTANLLSLVTIGLIHFLAPPRATFLPSLPGLLRSAALVFELGLLLSAAVTSAAAVDRADHPPGLAIIFLPVRSKPD